MRIEIDLSAANDPRAHQQLDRIVYRIDDGWHVWDTTSLLNPDIIKTTTWIRDRGPQGARLHEILDRSVRRDTWTPRPHGRHVRVTVHPNGTDDLSPEEAFRLADEPLQILVENRYSDGAFVKRAVTELDKALRKLWHQPGEPIRFDSLGGPGQMLEHIERRMQEKPYRPRLVVVVDSDRKGPGETESHTARTLRRKCDEWGIPCWVLAKREAENYLPITLLSQRKDVGADHAQLVEAWDRLTDDQKNFFDMKDGLPEELSTAEQELFDGLLPADWKVLSRGFGNNVYKCWNLWEGQAKNELIDRGQGDLERGIEIIWKEV